MPALRGQGNADDPATQYTVMHGHTPGPWTFRTVQDEDYDPNVSYWVDAPTLIPVADIRVNGSQEANAALIAAAPWHALLLRAVLKGWVFKGYFSDPDTGIGGSAPLGCWHFYQPGTPPLFIIHRDANGLPACPDADVYERIRKAVDGA